MKKLKFFASMLAILICFAGCSHESDELQTLKKNEVAAIENVKSELYLLNASYQSRYDHQTRMPKWLRWLIFGAADTAGAILGGVSGACGASTLAWNVTKTETTTKQDTLQTYSAIKANSLANIEVGSIGYIHNKVISTAFVSTKDLYLKNNDEVLDVIFDELSQQNGVFHSLKEKAYIDSVINLVVNNFDVNKSIEEYFNILIGKTNNVYKKEALNICRIVLEGLQNVDDSDVTYIEQVNSVVNNSDVDPTLKKILHDGISVAYASAKLWNTDEIKNIKLR